jgi:hypothetical protein
MLLFVTTEAAYPAATVAEMLKSQKKKSVSENGYYIKPV